jgi:ATP-GRASP peptide maturase of grasp-with-spasm system
MVLILSSTSDQSTFDVIKWLDYFEVPWVKLDSSIKLNLIRLDVNQGESSFVLETPTGERINTNELTGFWYRRSEFGLNYSAELLGLEEDELAKNIQQHLHYELSYLTKELHQLLSKKSKISDLRFSEPGKLEMLEAAKQVGIAIPPTLLTTSKIEFLNFKEKHGKVVSKAIQRSARFELMDNERRIEFLCYTEEMSEEELPTYFFPTLFQKKLAKVFELRIFYLNEKFYSMAIFSQEDQQTEVDFRNYNFEKPNRTVPFSLPIDLQKKLIQLMKNLHLKSGSIDMVLTEEGDYVFLEVNPVGQFGMVSSPCNYELSKLIAETLIQ